MFYVCIIKNIHITTYQKILVVISMTEVFIQFLWLSIERYAIIKCVDVDYIIFSLHSPPPTQPQNVGPE